MKSRRTFHEELIHTSLTVLLLGAGCAGNKESGPATDRIPEEYQGDWQSQGCTQNGDSSTKLTLRLAESDVQVMLNEYNDPNCDTVQRVYERLGVVQHVDDQGDKGLKLQLKEEYENAIDPDSEAYQVTIQLRLRNMGDMDVKLADKKDENSKKGTATVTQMALDKKSMRLSRAQ